MLKQAHGGPVGALMKSIPRERSVPSNSGHSMYQARTAPAEPMAPATNMPPMKIVFSRFATPETQWRRNKKSPGRSQG